MLAISMIVLGSFLLTLCPRIYYKCTHKPRQKKKREIKEGLERRFSAKSAHSPRTDDFASFGFSLFSAAQEMGDPSKTPADPTAAKSKPPGHTTVTVETTAPTNSGPRAASSKGGPSTSSEKEDKASNSSSGQQRSPNGDPVSSDPPPEPGEARELTEMEQGIANEAEGNEQSSGGQGGLDTKSPRRSRGAPGAASMSLVHVSNPTAESAEVLEEMWSSRLSGHPSVANLDISPENSPRRSSPRRTSPRWSHPAKRSFEDLKGNQKRNRRGSSQLSKGSVICLAELEEGRRTQSGTPSGGLNLGPEVPPLQGGTGADSQMGQGGVTSAVPREARDVTPPTNANPQQQSVHEIFENDGMVPRENLDAWRAEDKGLAAEGPLISDAESERSIVPHSHVAQDE